MIQLSLKSMKTTSLFRNNRNKGIYNDYSKYKGEKSIVQEKSLHQDNVDKQLLIPAEYIYYQATIQFNSSLMPKKPKCPTCSTGWCKNHLLELNPIHSNLYYKRNFKIRLCPRLNKQNNQFERIIPLLNTDKKFYTPNFYLQEEKKYYQENDERVQKNHRLKVEQDINSDETIWVPRHARKRNYCFVCKDDYNDYLEHMDDQYHKKCLRNNNFTTLILELQEKFAHENEVVSQQKKFYDLKRQSTTQDSSSMSISESSPKSFQFIRKISKPNQELVFLQIPQIIEQN